MGKTSKQSRRVQEFPEAEEAMDVEDEIPSISEDEDGFSDYGGDEEADEDQQEEACATQGDAVKNAEIEELEREYMDLRHREQDLLENLRRHKDEDLLKGQAVKNQKALWDKTLELRFLLQKSFSGSNRLPQEPIKSSFCKSDDEVAKAYADVINSSKLTLDAILELQEALLDKNPSITQSTNGQSGKNVKHLDGSGNDILDGDEDWLQISQMHSRMARYRDKSVNKWQRKTQLTTGAAAIKGKLQAFNQNVSEQVAFYMRDPSKMINGMQQKRSAVAMFGNFADSTADATTDEVAKTDGDPELLDDSEFYQQLLKEFFETFDPTSSEKAYYSIKRLQTKKRKIVDRRASKSRKIRYHVHDKIVNFMVSRPMDLPPMAPKLFENLFGLRSQ